MNQDEPIIEVKITVDVPQSFARAFRDCVTRTADPLLLAIEKVIDEKVEAELQDGERHPGSFLTLDRLDDIDLDQLTEAAEREARDRKVYGPWAS